jgi:TDG/mug DNA glycosylase family protein
VTRPSPDELGAATERTVADIVAPDLAVLFCGINPGRYSGATGHHFAGPGNRFWKALHLSGFTDRELRWDESGELLGFGIGITNLVSRTTATAAEVQRAEYALGADRLRRVVEVYQPAVVAILGVGAYRHAFDRKAGLGRQAGEPAGTTTFVLPNPSGLQARYQLSELVTMFVELREATPSNRRRGTREGSST